MSREDTKHWDERYRQGLGPQAGPSALRLAPYAAFVDALATERSTAGFRPNALDLACGAGGTVLWLALRGWRATGVDASDVALDLARAAVELAGVADCCEFLQVDLDVWRPEPHRYDLLSCFFFLNRDLWPSMRTAIRPGGLLVAESYNMHRLAKRPAANRSYLLQIGELQQEVQSWGWELLERHSHGPHLSRPTDVVVARRPS